MASPLGSMLKGNSTAEQLFVWGVLSVFVSSLLSPFVRAAEQFANSAAPNAVLTPDVLADMVERGRIDHATAAEQAQKSGLHDKWFSLLVNNAGNPPGPGEIAEALRRGIIPEGSITDTQPSFMSGIAQSRLKTEWAGVLKALDTRLPGPETAVVAAVRSMLSSQEAQQLYAKFGGDPETYQLLYNVTGEGPSPVEAGVLANRGIIPWTGTGPEATSFEQAVLEGRSKNKWLPALRALAVYIPPPRTTVAQWREGSIDTAQATKQLLNYGVPADVVPAYLQAAKKTTVAKAHEATEAEILRLYQEAAITKEEATTFLKQHGYPDSEIPIILEYGDLQVRLRQETAGITAVHRLFSHGKIDFNEAKALLTTNQVPDERSNYLLTIWEQERKSGTKDLTVKEIFDLVGAKLLDNVAALNHLMGIGYSPSDAALLLALNTSPEEATAAGGTLPPSTQAVLIPPTTNP